MNRGDQSGKSLHKTNAKIRMEPNKQKRTIGGGLDSSLTLSVGAPHHHGDLGYDGPTIEIKEKTRETHHFGEKWERRQPQGF